MELHCDLSRAPLGTGKHFDDAEGMGPNRVKMMYSKSSRNHSNGDAIAPHYPEFSGERNTTGEVPTDSMHAKVSISNQASKNSLHPRPKALSKKLKENGSQTKNRCGHGKSAQDSADVEVRMQSCKEQKENTGLNSGRKKVASEHSNKVTGSDRPIRKRRQKQASNGASERGKDQCPRGTKRKHEPEKLPAPNLPTGRGVKRSRRVAQRLAQEEPPPPPLKLPRLHIVLTRKEIQEDWIKITGHKYTGKPKKSTLNQKGLGLCIALTCPSSIDYLSDPH